MGGHIIYDLEKLFTCSKYLKRILMLLGNQERANFSTSTASLETKSNEKPKIGATSSLEVAAAHSPPGTAIYSFSNKLKNVDILTK